MNRYVLATALLSAAIAGPALSQERRLTASDLPAAVRQTADRESRGGTVRGYSSETEQGRLQYEVELVFNGRSRDITIGPDGTILEVEQQVDLDSLPQAVRNALTKKAGAGRITRVESLTKHGTLVAYEAAILTAGRRSEAQVGPDGEPLAHEE